MVHAYDVLGASFAIQVPNMHHHSLLVPALLTQH
jgi:hypothetical protein